MVYWVVAQKMASEVWGIIVVNCLQKKVAVLSSLVTCLLLKVIGWLGGLRCSFLDVLAISLKRRPVSCARWQDSTPIFHFCKKKFRYCFGNLLVQGLIYVVIGVLLSSLIMLLDEAFGCFWQINGRLSHTLSWEVVLGRP